MLKVSSGPFLSIHSFCSILQYSAILLADSEVLDQSADAQPGLGLRCPHIPEEHFCMACLILDQTRTDSSLRHCEERLEFGDLIVKPAYDR